MNYTENHINKYPALDQIPKFTQRQDSVKEQLSDLIEVAIKLGMHDAVDWIKMNLRK